MAFDLKENWPIVGAGALALFGLAALRSGGAAASSGGYQVVQPDTSGEVQTATATLGAQTAQLQLVGSALDSYLHYEDSIHAIDAQSYAVTEQALTDEFHNLAQENQAALLADAEIKAAQAAKPSFLQQFTNFIATLAQTYFGFKGGGSSAGYLAPVSGGGAPGTY